MDRLRAGIAGAGRSGRGAAAQPGPSAGDVAAAGEMSPEQREAMVRGMVSRLAERLKQDGGDVEGWLRLLRAYMVLGDRSRRAPPRTTRGARSPAIRTSFAGSTT